MGAGIAQVLAAGGTEVVLVESDPDAAAGAEERLTAGLDRAAERAKLSDPVAEVVARVRIVTDIEDLPEEAALVVEAVPERMDLKASVLGAAERAVGDDTILATNTSSLPITELAASLRLPGRFIGMHFFNPVPASKLVEVIVGTETTHAVQSKVIEWVQALGKTGVVVRDSPGFATSRLGVLLGLEAIRMLEAGVADAEGIDQAMELGYGHPMGPLRSTDLVGLDVRLAIAEHLHAALGERFAPPQLLRDKVGRGELGRKSGRGFHDWS